MATKTITSGENKTKVGTTGTELYTRTRITYTLDENGKINSDTVKTDILFQQVPGDPPVVAATKTGNGRDFTFTKNEFTGKEYFGADAQKSLKEGALKTTTTQQIDSVMKKEGLTADQKQSIKASSVASNPESSNDEATLADVNQGVEFSNQLINNQAIKDGDGIRKEYGQNLIYPITFPENQDRIKFSMFRYSPRRLEVNENLGATSKNRVGEKTIFGNVILPISPSISDQNTVSWGDDTLNAIEALAAATAYRGISEGPKGIAKSIENIARGSTDPALKTAAAAYFAAAAAGGNKNFLSRVTGGVLNPNLELLFNGPQLRTFSFSFTLSAREPNESKRIREIIRFFKQGMSVKRATSNLFVKAPNIFDISNHLGSGAESDHPWINKIKTCALTNCSVNYTPAGNYATFYDGAMTAYELTLSFSELDPIFEDDYKDLGNRDGNTVNKDTMIGY